MTGIPCLSLNKHAAARYVLPDPVIQKSLRTEALFCGKERINDFSKCINSVEEPSFIREYMHLKNEYKSDTNAINDGKMNHEKIYTYLSEKIYQNEDLDF